MSLPMDLDLNWNARHPCPNLSLNWSLDPGQVRVETWIWVWVRVWLWSRSRLYSIGLEILPTDRGASNSLSAIAALLVTFGAHSNPRDCFSIWYRQTDHSMKKVDSFKGKFALSHPDTQHTQRLLVKYGGMTKYRKGPQRTHKGPQRSITG